MSETPYIEARRQCALKLLKPSGRDLDHGLELHRNAVVVETYGFGPVGPVDPARLLALARTGASVRELQDCREETSMTGYLYDERQLQAFKAAWDASGVTCIFRNTGEEGQSPTRLLRRMAYYIHVTDRLGDFLPKALDPDGIVRAKCENRHCLCLTCNGVPLAQEWNSVEEELGYIHLFFQLGARMMHLTYNRRNMIGDGCAEAANGGLSDLGRAAVAEMNRVGVIADVAHAGWQTSLETARVSQKPVVASHTVCAALNPHMRSKPDEVIRAIADGGGLVGICAVPAFLGGAGDINAMLDHIDHVTKKFGVDFVGIGTDLAASLPAPPSDDGLRDELKSALARRRKGFESLWPFDEPLFRPEWQKDEQLLSLAWVNFPLFTVGLVQRGYRDDDIRKILGGNMLRVFGAVLPESEKTSES